jgi:hypothetical protein
VSRYSVEIKALTACTVSVTITRTCNGETCGWELFGSFFNTHKALENNFKRARNWANARIKILEQNEEV